MPITVNVAGQVGQIRLPTSKALWPLFETVINSIQSLEESDTKKKVIVIDALRPEHTQLKTGEQGRTIIEEQAHFEAFTVTDFCIKSPSRSRSKNRIQFCQEFQTCWRCSG